MRQRQLSLDATLQIEREEPEGGMNEPPTLTYVPLLLRLPPPPTAAARNKEREDAEEERFPVSNLFSKFTVNSNKTLKG
mgnify:CR=1 FL=1